MLWQEKEDRRRVKSHPLALLWKLRQLFLYNHFHPDNILQTAKPKQVENASFAIGSLGAPPSFFYKTSATG